MRYGVQNFITSQLYAGDMKTLQGQFFIFVIVADIYVSKYACVIKCILTSSLDF